VRELETDYLVIGGGASGMAFADTLVAHSDAEVVIVDRRHGPGGHWHDAYPFVRLHQPSAYYGVESRPLGNDHIDEHGPNAGFYERASSAEICDYYAHVLDEELLPTGRVRFLGLGDYRGEERVVSLLDGTETRVKARRKVVDATHVQPEIPSRHTPGFTVEAGVALVPPNALVDVAEPPDRFTVIGAGKTAIDTCVWLLDEGVDPDRIRWIRGRDPWQFDRTFTQPLTLVGSYMQLQARWVEAAAAATDGHDFAHRLEAAGIFLRLDPAVQPQAFRGATVSAREIDGARRIDDVVRAASPSDRPDVPEHRRGRDCGEPARSLRRLHCGRRATGGGAAGLRRWAYNGPVRGRRTLAVVGGHHRLRRIDAPLRGGEEPPLSARGVQRRCD
jgi:hypothetical protein